MPTLTPPDHGTYQMWLHLEPDGELTRAELGALARHLAACAACRAERREIAALGDRLAAAAVAADPALARNVMANLPPAGWEARNPRSWTAALGLLALLGVAAAVAARLGAAEPAPALAGAFVALLDLFRSAALAGAGLIGASWRGVGLALGEALADSPVGFIVFGVLVAALDVLFVRFLLRAMRGAGAHEAEQAARSTGRPDRGNRR